jgi:hypothetical protein
MNRRLSQACFLEPGGLYAPQSRQRASENCLCSDRIGVTCATTDDTQKFLSVAVFFMHRSAVGTGSGSVGRIYANKQNTVLLCFVFDPVEYPPVCPRRHSFTKRFTSALLLAPLHIVKGFDANCADCVPGHLIDNSIDQILALLIRFGSSFAAGFAAFDLISDLFELCAVMIPIRVREQLVHSNINGEGFSFGFDALLRNFGSCRLKGVDHD